MKVWLDDVRLPPEGWVWVKTANHAISLLQEGMVTEISLDNDLGLNMPMGYEVAKFIEKGAFLGTLSRLEVYIHTQNPVARTMMSRAILNAYQSWKNRKND